jgi:hypothetical protein
MRAGEAKAPGRRSLALRAIVVVVALLVGWLLGRGAGQAGERSTGGDGAPEAIHIRAGVPVGFSRTPGGAAAAVAAYQRAFASPAILRPGVLRKRIKAVATPDYVAEMLAVNSPGGERIAAGPIGVGLASGLQTLYSAVPIGYEVESFTPQRARILTWGFTLLGNASAVEPAAYFGLSHTELVWSKDGWRIAETRAGFGPTPKLATSPGPLGGYDVMNLAQRLESYELAP